MSGAIRESIARWDAFLAQIQGRHRDVLAAAEAEARSFIAAVAAGGDVLPLSHQLMAVTARLQDLESKIIDAWHAKVEQAIFDDGLAVADRDREYVKGRTLQRALENLREELEPRVFAELSRQRYGHALAAARAMVCDACGAQRSGGVWFRATELTCGCGARLLFEPGDLMRSVTAIGAHSIAQEAAIVEWRAMRAAGHRMHDLRPPRPLAAVVDYERAQIAYWRAYLAVRARFEPEIARDPTMEIRSRMEAWYVSHAEFEEAWVAAGRPRLAI
jgi:hypothetical protein